MAVRIGIVISTGPASGGTYFYSLKILDAFKHFGQEHEYIVFYDDQDFPVKKYALPHWTLVCQRNRADRLTVKIARVAALLGLTFLLPLARGRHQSLIDYQCDLVVCPSTTLAAYWCGLPFVVAVHDVWHRYRLPGRTMFSEPFRDLIFKRAVHAAKSVLVESELGKKEVIQAYMIPEKKIYIVPTGPATFVWETSDQPERQPPYELPSCYVFYPGGFQVAKNQQRVVEAIALIKEKYQTDIHAVFTGFKNCALVEKILQLAKSSGVEKSIRILGNVPDAHMRILYQRALCLVMASYIGPTNMPIWEAFALGCPVISSNAGGMPEQVGDAGLLFDPDNAGQLADAILKLYNDRRLRESFIEKGYKRMEPLKPENWERRLMQIMEEVSEK